MGWIIGEAIRRTYCMGRQEERRIQRSTSKFEHSLPSALAGTMGCWSLGGPGGQDR